MAHILSNFVLSSIVSCKIIGCTKLMVAVKASMLKHKPTNLNSTVYVDPLNEC